MRDIGFSLIQNGGLSAPIETHTDSVSRQLPSIRDTRWHCLESATVYMYRYHHKQSQVHSKNDRVFLRFKRHIYY